MVRRLHLLCTAVAAQSTSWPLTSEPDDALSLVQAGSRFRVSSDGRLDSAMDRPEMAEKCLRFIHNPRTGGTTIDSMNLHLPKGHRAFDSLMEGPLDRAAGGPLWPNLTAGELFDQAHGTEMKDESAGAAARHYAKYIPDLHFRFVTWQHDGYVQRCQDLHTPPQYDALVEQFFTEPGCTTFCSVRNPMARLLSAYNFQSLGACSVAAFDQWILATFPLRSAISFCHAYPQVEYVYNAPTKEAATKQWCQRVIRYEHFEEDFNQVMEEFGRPLRLTRHLFSTKGCHIDWHWVSTQAKELVYNTYRADYDAFGYPRPY
mmetsp:Transcript_116825/g.342084  ORF Transcript_116825/g.342084 Transcript_116825/m.342084 type:complete len:317 (+) Transcript_116825:42-992(+)